MAGPPWSRLFTPVRRNEQAKYTYYFHMGKLQFLVFILNRRIEENLIALSREKAELPARSYGLAQHICGFAAGFLLPFQEEYCVRVGDVLIRGDFQATGHGVDPLGRPFDFPKVANWCFIHYHMALGIGPFSTELFIAKAWSKAQCFKNSGHGRAVFDPGFDLFAG